MDRCKHQFLPGQCAQCSPPVYPSKVAQGRAAGTNGEYPEGFVCIRSIKNHSSLKELNFRTLTVHITDTPRMWLLQEIYERARYVKKISVIPSVFEAHVKDSHRKFCDERNIELVAGYARPEMAWEEGERRPNNAFKGQQAFMKQLHPERQHYFDELRRFGFEAAEMAAIHYEIDKGEFVSGWKIAKQFGLKTLHSISEYILSVVHYLDPSFPVSDRSMQIAATMLRRVIRLREVYASKESQIKLAHQYGLPHLPERLSPSRLEVFEKILQQRATGRLAQLQWSHPRHYQILLYRYGLEGAVPTSFRRLREMGDIIGISHERVRQIEEVALYAIGVHDPDAEMVESEARKFGTNTDDIGDWLANIEFNTAETLKNQEKILEIVLYEFDLTKEQILSQSREQPLARPRQVLMYLLRELLGMSWPKIGTFIGERDHTTAMHGHAKITDLLRTDEELRQHVDVIKKAMREMYNFNSKEGKKQHRESIPRKPRGPQGKMLPNLGAPPNVQLSQKIKGETRSYTEDQMMTVFGSVVGYYGISVPFAFTANKKENRALRARSVFVYLMSHDHSADFTSIAAFLQRSVREVEGSADTIDTQIKIDAALKKEVEKIRDRIQGFLATSGM